MSEAKNYTIVVGTKLSADSMGSADLTEISHRAADILRKINGVLSVTVDQTFDVITVSVNPDSVEAVESAMAAFPEGMMEERAYDESLGLLTGTE